MRTIYYADATTEVEEGDVVEYKSTFFWRGWKPGVVSYVPGVSEFHPEMEHHGLSYIGVSGDDGTFRGVYVDPDTGHAKASIRFKSRGDMSGVLRPHDIKPDEW